MGQHARTWEESPNIAKWRRKQGVNRQYIRAILMRFSLSLGVEQIHIRILAFYGPGTVLGILNLGSGLRPSGFTWQVPSASLADDVIQVWINSSPSNHCISHFKAPLAQLFFIQHLICTYWIVAAMNTPSIFCNVNFVPKKRVLNIMTDEFSRNKIKSAVI